MAIREIVFTISEDRRSLSPSTVQDGGVQGEHNATRVVFRFAADSVWNQSGNAVYVEWDHATGGTDYSLPLDVADAADGMKQVAFLVSEELTRYGGTATLRLVAEANVGNDLWYSPEARLRFDSRQNAQEKMDGLLKGRLAQIEKAAGDAVKAAGDTLAGANEAQAAAEAAQAAAEVAKEGAGRVLEEAIQAAGHLADGASTAANRAENAATNAAGYAQTAANAANFADAANTEANRAKEAARASESDAEAAAREAASAKKETVEAMANIDAYKTAAEKAQRAAENAKTAAESAAAGAEDLKAQTDEAVTTAKQHADTAESGAKRAEHAAELAMAQLGAKAAITGPNTVVFTQLDLSDLPPPPTYTTEKDTEKSKDDGSGYHCVTLEKTETAFEYAEAGTELTVMNTTGSKVWCVGDNRFPMTELVSSEPQNDGNRRLTVNDDGSITVRFYATIDLPFPLPAGYYAISATVVDFGYKENDAVVSNSYPRFDLRNADNTTAIASEYSYYADAAAWGRAGCILYASEPFSQIRIYSANGNNSSGGAWATALESKLQDVCMMYYSSQPVRTRDIYTNRDYCGEIYDIADGKATITMPDAAKTVFAFDDGGNSVAFDVMYSYQKAAETPVAPDEPLNPEYHEGGELREMAVGNRMFRSFRDVVAQRDAAEARRIAGEAQKAAPPAATDADNGKVLKMVGGKPVWAEDAVGAAELPAATDADNGKVLKMVGGKPVWAEDAVGGAEAASDELPAALAMEIERVQTESMETGVNTDLSLLVFADPHSFAEEYAWGDPYHFHPYKYEKYAKMMENPAVDFMLCLGDINPYGDHTKSRCIEGMQKILTVAGKKPNCLYVPGNHDVVVGYGGPTLDNTLTKKEQYNLLCSHLVGHARFDYADPYGCHYYVDHEASKIRIIVLNATDVWDGEVVEAGDRETTICMRQAQMNWFTNAALDLSDKEGWSVLVCVHTITFNSNDKTVLTRILSAVKNGGTVSITGDTRFTVNKSYETQGARGVIGVFFGHGHQDELYESNGIKCLQFGTDNAHVDESYIAALGEGGLAADDYYIETRNGTRFGRSFGDYLDARYVTFNNYIGGSSTWWNLLDADKNVITFGYAYPEGQTNGYTHDMKPIATRWTKRRVEGTATTESCYIVNIDKTAGTITKLPYGVGEHRVIQYR